MSATTTLHNNSTSSNKRLENWLGSAWLSLHWTACSIGGMESKLAAESTLWRYFLQDQKGDDEDDEDEDGEKKDKAFLGFLNDAK